MRGHAPKVMVLVGTSETLYIYIIFTYIYILEWPCLDYLLVQAPSTAGSY